MASQSFRQKNAAHKFMLLKHSGASFIQIKETVNTAKVRRPIAEKIATSIRDPRLEGITLDSDGVTSSMRERIIVHELYDRMHFPLVNFITSRALRSRLL
jgi:hypothetical protein